MGSGGGQRGPANLSLPLVLKEAAEDGSSQGLGCSASLKTPELTWSRVAAWPEDLASPPSRANLVLSGLEQAPQAL